MERSGSSRRTDEAWEDSKNGFAQVKCERQGDVESVDVVVVGAGLSGLVAAKRLADHGLNVRVIEAKSRVGGRLKSTTLFSGHTVDDGGAWVGPQQTAILALLRELGMETYPQYDVGRHLIRRGGRTRYYTGSTPSLDLLSLIDLAIVQARLNRMARQVSGPSPWSAREAHRMDQQTLGHWIDCHVRTSGARLVIELLTALSFGCTPSELSLFAFAIHVASAGDLATLINVRNGALQWRIAGGAASAPVRLAAILGERVCLGRPVRRIDRSEKQILIEAEDRRWRARGVIVAVDPATARSIEHIPRLPPQREHLECRYTMGSGRKIHVVYDRPFWRDAGLSGQAIADQGITRASFDSSPPDASVGVLTTFAGLALGERRDLLQSSAAEPRRAAVLQELSALFGPLALRPVEYVEQDWTGEPYQAGCLPCPGTGLMSTCGESLLKPHDGIHWAGAETSHIWEGHMDGAVRSGERAAKEVVARFVE